MAELRSEVIVPGIVRSSAGSGEPNAIRWKVGGCGPKFIKLRGSRARPKRALPDTEKVGLVRLKPLVSIVGPKCKRSSASIGAPEQAGLLDTVSAPRCKKSSAGASASGCEKLLVEDIGPMSTRSRAVSGTPVRPTPDANDAGPDRPRCRTNGGDPGRKESRADGVEPKRAGLLGSMGGSRIVKSRADIVNPRQVMPDDGVSVPSQAECLGGGGGPVCKESETKMERPG